MRIIKGLITIVFLILPLTVLAQDVEKSSHEIATKAFLQQHQEMFYDSILASFNQYFSNDPSLIPYLPAINIFVNKHMSWEEIEPKLIKVYMDLFTEDELNELNSFLSTPIGKKLTEHTPFIIMTFQQIGLEILVNKQAEFEEIIQTFLADS